MWELRNAVNQLLKELCFSRVELLNMYREKHQTKLSAQELSKYLNGSIETPKSRKVLSECLQILIDEQAKLKDLIAQAQV